MNGYPHRYSFARKECTVEPGPPPVKRCAYATDGAPSFADNIVAAFPQDAGNDWFVATDGTVVGFVVELTAGEQATLAAAYASWDPNS